MPFYAISPSNMDKTILVMHERVNGKYPSLRKEYAPFSCPECEMFTKGTLAVFEEVGIPKDVHIPLKRDLMGSHCRQEIVSSRFKKMIEDFEGAEAVFLPIPNNPEYFIFFPRRLVEFPANMPVVHWTKKPPAKDILFAYSADHECSTCTNRPVFFWEKFFAPPKEAVLGGIQTVGIGPVSYYIFVNEALAIALKKARLTGIHFMDNFFKK